MSDREQRGLRGPVKSCIDDSTYSDTTDADGKIYPEVHSEYTTEYDTAGRMLATRSRNSDGSEWVTRYDYDLSGRLMKTASGTEGQAITETTYSYDHGGRLQNINDGSRLDSPVTFLYDDFEAAERAPNLPGGGSTTTIYDEHDRATEVQVRDASGELVKRAVRTYDAQGHVMEEKLIWDNPERMFPADALAQMLEQSGLSPDQLQQELHTQLTKLMAGQSGPYSVSYGHDTLGRITHTSRRIFNENQEIETVYNEHGDAASEITRSTRLAAQTDSTAPAVGLPSYSEVRYSYKYDSRENWIEQATSYRSAPDGAFQSSTVVKRTLTYY